MLNSKTRLYGVIGSPISHSLSPILQNWMIRAFGLNAVYLAFRVDVNDLGRCVDGMRSLGISGLNVTIPHKENVLGFVDEKSADVLQLGASNTLHNRDGRICAHVTDPVGFTESLGERKSLIAGGHVTLIGAGGAARSVTFALAQLGVKKLYNLDVMFERTLRLTHLAVTKLRIQEAVAVQYGDPSIHEAILDSSVVINASPVGMHPDNGCPLADMSAVSGRHFVYDLVYNPGMTPFLQRARDNGASVQNGLDMLIFQGLESLRIWQGQPYRLDRPALEQLRALLKSELNIHE